MTEERKIPIWFWVIGVVALLWNGMGVAAYIVQATMTTNDFGALPELQRKLLIAQPFWHSAMFPLAVLSGFLGAAVLLLRKRIAIRLLLLSLIAVLVQTAGYFILDGYLEFIETQGWAMPIMIPVIALGLLLFARYCDGKGLLR
jgi:hypothetical protein